MRKKDEKLLNKKNQSKYQKILAWSKIFSFFKYIAQENITQKFRLKNIDETRNYSVKEIEQNGLTSKKYEKVCVTLNYIKQFVILAFHFYFAYSVSIPISIKISTMGLKICTITPG